MREYRATALQVEVHRALALALVCLVASGCGTGGVGTDTSTPGTTPPPPATVSYSLSASTTGSGSISSTPAGIDCGQDCAASFTAGTSVTLTAMPATNYQFAGWGGACSGTNPNCTIAMNGDRAVSASFTVSTPAPPPTGTPVRLTRAGEVYTLGADLTAPGTAFEITADDVVLDLGGRTVTYNAQASAARVYGVNIGSNADRVTIRNGTIIQGGGNSNDSPAIYFAGSSQRGHVLHDLVIRTIGYQSNGIQADGGGFNSSRIARVYVEVLGDTEAIDGYGADPIVASAPNGGAVDIRDSILVAGHRGINLFGICESCRAPYPPSTIRNNKIQQQRRLNGSKAPYGIAVSGISRGIDVYGNQIISDDGRGIIFNGWGQGSSDGTTFCRAFDNRIDVQYARAVSAGAYVENNVYGLRDRYHSGSNRFERNVVLVANDIDGPAAGAYIGSDSSDPDMHDIVLRDNIFILRQGEGTGARDVNYFDAAESIDFSDNRYIGALSADGSRVTHLTMTNNTVFNPPATAAPAVPTGVRLTRFLDSYLLEWDANSEADVLEYVVYRDGQRLPISPRGGTFYVDVRIGGTHSYQVSALTLAGVESARSAAVSTTGAKNAWW